MHKSYFIHGDFLLTDFKYKPIPVPRENIITIMKAGLDAPSGCNKQTTSLIAVDDQEILKKLHSVINTPVGETAPAVPKKRPFKDRAWFNSFPG